MPGIGPTRLCVECKYVSPARSTSIPNQLVLDFVSVFRAKRESQRWTAGVVVSNVGFTDSAKAAAVDASDVHLKTIDDLYEELLKVRAYLWKGIRSIESAGDIVDYVPLNARILDERMNRSGHTATLQSIIREMARECQL